MDWSKDNRIPAPSAKPASSCSTRSSVNAAVRAGARHVQEQPVGRYRMSVTTRGNFTDIYVIDTMTGAVKYLGKDEGKPFDQVRGK